MEKIKVEIVTEDGNELYNYDFICPGCSSLVHDLYDPSHYKTHGVVYCSKGCADLVN